MTGLGALGIALYIDTCSSSPPEDRTKEALRCVFAEELEMSNLIVNCLLYCILVAKEKDGLRGKIDQSEGQMSAALTRLKNSMVSEGHMSPEALKAWVERGGIPHPDADSPGEIGRESNLKLHRDPPLSLPERPGPAVPFIFIYIIYIIFVKSNPHV